MGNLNKFFGSGNKIPNKKTETRNIIIPEYKYDIPKDSHVFSIPDFLERVEGNYLVDYDGHGNPARNGKMACNLKIKPSKVNEIPDSADSIIWYNR